MIEDDQENASTLVLDVATSYRWRCVHCMSWVQVAGRPGRYILTEHNNLQAGNRAYNTPCPLEVLGDEELRKILDQSTPAS